MTKLIIVRHGNTFANHETPLRIGARTDLPLVESGEQQAIHVGQWLKKNRLVPAAIYSGQLKRALLTAELLAKELPKEIPIIKDPQFNEIDYGIDEGKTESEVLARIGSRALQAWEQQAIVPPGWQVNPQMIIENWLAFAEFIAQTYSGKTIVVVTSNGVARFAPYLTGRFAKFQQQYAIKISTGALCILNKMPDHWQVERWNFRPE